MNRERLAWTVSLILLTVLALRVPGTLAQRDDDYAFVRTLVDIHRQVIGHYVEEVDEARLRQAAIDGMLQQLDPFTVFIPPHEQEAFEDNLEGVFRGVGIRLDQLDNGEIEVVSPIEDSPALRAGVLAGDVILKVNGEPITGLRLPDVVRRIAGPVGTEVTLTVRHPDGTIEDLTMTRQEIRVPTVTGFRRNQDNTWDYYILNDPKIAYLRITQFTSETAQNVKSVVTSLVADGMRGLVLDLRFNPGGRLDVAVDLVDLFLDEGVIVRTRGRARPEHIVRATPNGLTNDFPMVVLVNEHSASAAEVTAGSLMENRRALVIGMRTYGKGSVQEVVRLDGKGGELKITTQYYYLPSGRLVHRRKDATDWGVEPQIIVPLDEEAQRRVLQERYQRELFRRPTTTPATQPANQPVDAQLQRAIDTLVGLIVLSDMKNR